MDIWLGDRLSVLVNGIAKVCGIHNIQKDATEEGQDYPAHKETDSPQNCCLLHEIK